MSQYLDKDGASRISENFLSKQAEQDAALRNLRFDLKEAEHALVKTIQGQAPLNIRALSRPLDDYLISGNTIQNGTPTPDDPIYPQECGDRTAQLLDTYNNYFSKGYINNNGNLVSDPQDWMGYSGYIKIKPNTAYTISPQNSSNAGFDAFYDSNKQHLSSFNGHGITSEGKYTGISPSTAAYIRVSGSSPTRYPIAREHLMVNEGSTALPYEPYGYKIPITCGGVTQNIYLGEVQTTRKIKKIVLDGTENWQPLWGVLSLGLSTAADTTPRATTVMCDRYNAKNNVLQAQGYPSQYGDCSITFRDYNSSLLIRDDRYGADTAAYKSYLADQYAAGTPVTVWYVLATPETGIVNEPLRKIGDYADTISMTQAGVMLTTTKGFNTITTNTTVLPSIIEVKGVINNA